MNPIDLNLLTALDVLLSERSVTRAAQRLGLSPSAMSRTLTRLRVATGDPLLVQAGRSLVATPHAEVLVERVREAAREARAVLSPVSEILDPQTLQRSFTIRANEGFVALFAAVVVAAVNSAAPNVRLRFVPESDKDAAPLRTGEVDLEIGVAGESGPEVRSRIIFRDRFVGAARADHPLLKDVVTPQSFAACGHVVASRRGAASGPVDEALRELGLERHVAVVVPGFPDALNIARRSDLVALVPRSCFASGDLATEGLVAFELPVPTPDLDIAAMWHPRHDNDSANRWLRETVISACRDNSSSRPEPSSQNSGRLASNASD